MGNQKVNWRTDNIMVKLRSTKWQTMINKHYYRLSNMHSKIKRGWTSMVRRGRESITQCLRSMFLYDKAMDDYAEEVDKDNRSPILYQLYECARYIWIIWYSMRSSVITILPPLNVGSCIFEIHRIKLITPTTLTKEETLDNHRSVLYSFGISTKDEELDLPSLYRIAKLHKCPFKQRYIAGSAKCSPKPLSKLLTCILSAVKTGLQS